MKFMLFLTALTAIGIAQSPPPEKPPAPTQQEELQVRVDAIARRVVEKDGVPGISIAIGKDTETLIAQGWGYADAHAGRTASADTIFAIGSLTRQFTAVAILQLVEAGKLSLDDDIAKLLPDFPAQGRKITLRHLLSDSSGIPGLGRLVPRKPVDGKAADAKKPDTPRGGGAFEQDLPKPSLTAAAEGEFLHRFRNAPFDFEPGTAYSTDTSGYVLLGMIVARASGQSWSDVIRTKVIQPAGLERTALCPPEEAPAGYAEDCKQLVVPSELELATEARVPRSYLSLCSSAKDLLRWQTALTDRKLLGEEMSRALVTTTPLSGGKAAGPNDKPADSDDRTTGAGFATSLGELEQQKLQAHTGGIDGFAVRVARYPDAQVTIVVLANCASAEVEAIEQEIARAVLGLPPSELIDLPVDASTVERCCGTYQIATTRIRIFARDGHLWYEQPTQAAFALLHQGQGAFVWSSDKEARMVFKLEEDGPAKSFELTRNGLVSNAQRME